MAVKNEAGDHQLRYSLIAHEKGTDNYVVAAMSGTLMACGNGLVDGFRRTESLVAFDVLAKHLLAEQKLLEQEQIIPSGTAQDSFIRAMTDLLESTVMYLGYPPKEDVEFFSLPQGLVENLHWAPRLR